MADSEVQAATLSSMRGGLCSGFTRRKDRLEQAVAQAKALKTSYALDKMRSCLQDVVESFYKIEECVIKEDTLDTVPANVNKRKGSLEVRGQAQAG